MSAAAWGGTLERCGIPPGSDAAGQLGAYLVLLVKWNRHINLTASTREPDLAPLVEESVWAAGIYRERMSGLAAPDHLDIGSGAGFPAIPLKVLNPGMRLTLLESRERKALFLEHVVRELGLAGVDVRCRRLSDQLNDPGESGGWNRFSWKAVRLAVEDWQGLLEVAAAGAEYWLFHGDELPVAGPEEFRRRMTLVSSLPVPHRLSSYLSIYQ